MIKDDSNGKPSSPPSRVFPGDGDDAIQSSSRPRQPFCAAAGVSLFLPSLSGLHRVVATEKKRPRPRAGGRRCEKPAFPRQRAATCGGVDHVLDELQRQPAVRRPRDDILAHEIEAAEAVNKSVRGKSPERCRLAEKQGLRAITGRGDGGGHAGRANTIYDDIVIRFDRGGVVGFQMAKEVVLVMGGEIDQR